MSLIWDWEALHVQLIKSFHKDPSILGLKTKSNLRAFTAELQIARLHWCNNGIKYPWFHMDVCGYQLL